MGRIRVRHARTALQAAGTWVVYLEVCKFEKKYFRSLTPTNCAWKQNWGVTSSGSLSPDCPPYLALLLVPVGISAPAFLAWHCDCQSLGDVTHCVCECGKVNGSRSSLTLSQVCASCHRHKPFTSLIAVICVTKSRTGDYDFRACARARGFRGSTFSVGRIRFFRETVVSS